MNKLRCLKYSLYLMLFLSNGLTHAPAQEPSAEEHSPKTATPLADQTVSKNNTTGSLSTDQSTNPVVEPSKPVGPPPLPPTATMDCSPNPVPIAAPVTCMVTITHPNTMTVKVNAPPSAESGIAALPEPTPNGDFVTKRLFTLRQVELDKPLRIKNVRISWSALGGHEGIVKLPNQKIPIRSMLMGVSDPVARDFKHPLGKKLELGADEVKIQTERQSFWIRHAPPSLLEPNLTLIIILSMIVVTALGTFLGWIIRKWAEARAKNKEPYVDPRPAHIIAFEALSILEKARLIEDGAFKVYSHRLSEIARAYFGKRYDFNGLEMTSDELREALELIDLSAETYLVLEDFLSDTDLIKFADLSTSAQALEESRNRVYRLIDLTKQEEEEEVLTESEAESGRAQYQTMSKGESA